MLEGTGYETRLDKDRMLKVKDYFAKVRPRYEEFLSEFTGVETEIFDSQIPGGMISNMESQLKQQGAGDRLHEVLAGSAHACARTRAIRRWSPLEPDRRHAGRIQRADGTIQGASPASSPT